MIIHKLTKEVRAKLFFLAFTLFMVMVGFSILFPILPLFVKEELGGNARHLGFLFAIYSIVQLIFAPMWGMWSDKHGRKPAILIGVIGIILTFLLIAISQSILHLFIARIVGGVLTAAALPAVFAYAADITNKEQRGPAIALIGGSLGMGIVFGPALGALFSTFAFVIPIVNWHVTHFRTPFLAGCVLGLINLAILFKFLNNNAGEIAVSERSLSPLQRVIAAFTSHVRYYYLFALMISLSFSCLTSTFALYANQRFGAGPMEMGIIFAVFGLFGSLFQGLASGVLINRFGEPLLIKIGVPLMAVAFLGITFASNTLWFAVGGCVVGIAQGMTFPSIASAISKGSMIGQGSALGLYDSMDSLGRIGGPIAGGVLFEMAPSYGSWHWPYYFGAAVLLLSIIVGTKGLMEISR